MTVSIRLSDEDTKIIKSYAEVKGVTVSELMRKSVLEQIEDEFDLKAYDEAMKEYKNNPVTYSHEEVARLLALNNEI